MKDALPASAHAQKGSSPGSGDIPAVLRTRTDIPSSLNRLMNFPTIFCANTELFQNLFVLVKDLLREEPVKMGLLYPSEQESPAVGPRVQRCTTERGGPRNHHRGVNNTSRHSSRLGRQRLSPAVSFFCCGRLELSSQSPARRLYRCHFRLAGKW